MPSSEDVLCTRSFPISVSPSKRPATFSFEPNAESGTATSMSLSCAIEALADAPDDLCDLGWTATENSVALFMFEFRLPAISTSGCSSVSSPWLLISVVEICVSSLLVDERFAVVSVMVTVAEAESLVAYSFGPYSVGYGVDVAFGRGAKGTNNN